MRTLTKERAIIMQAHSVRAILAGAKTQTRRVVKPQPSHEIVRCEGGRGFYERTPNPSSSGYTVFDSPYGAPGDRLWVREAVWTHVANPFNAHGTGRRYYDADIDDAKRASLKSQGWRRCSPMMMKRGFCRLTLEIAGVRVERVQEISGIDAWSEGVSPAVRPGFDVDIDGGLSDSGLQAGIDEYHRRWDALNAVRGFPWAANPWVWAVTFKQVEGGAS